jgi:multidrug transporter EmrE-like cation transporter
VQKTLTSTSPLVMASVIGTDLCIICGFVLYVLNAVVWLLVLTHIHVSRVYPFVGLGFLLTMVFGCFFIDWTTSIFRMAGTILVYIVVTSSIAKSKFKTMAARTYPIR